jgi:hypothetical protein
LVDAVRLEFGVDGLGEAGFHEADGFRPFEIEEAFQFGGGEKLHDGIGRKIFQHFFAGMLGDVAREQNEMQLVAVAADFVAAHQQNASLQDKRK